MTRTSETCDKMPTRARKLSRFAFRALPLLWVVFATASLASLTSCKGKGGAGAITVEINPGVSQTLDEGQQKSFTATLSNDTNNKGVTWSLTGTGCSGSGCGTLSSTTAATTTYTAPTPVSVAFSVSLKATSNASSAAASLTISVVLPPSFTTTSLPNALNGVQYNQTIVVTGGVAPLTFSLAAGSGSLPAGLNLNVTGNIVGTPIGFGTSNFTVQIVDSGGLAAITQAFSLTVNPAPPLSITTTSLAPASVNVPYTASVVAKGGVEPLTWSVTPNLPAGLALNTASGVISGTPTTAMSASPFTFSVQDSALPTHQTASVQLSLVVNPAQPLKISTTSLGSGTTAAAYNNPLAVSGGVPPYNFSLSNGQLPSGLSLPTKPTSSGSISGTPIVAGTSTFTVQVTDSETPVPNVVFSPPLSITIAAGTNNISLFSGSYTFLFSGFDSQGSVVAVGAFTAAGSSSSGTISAGLQDSNRVSGVVLAATLTGSFTVGADGRGTLSLTATNSTGGVLKTAYDLVLESDGSARMIENDTTGTQGTGIIKRQSSSSLGAGSFSGHYAFALGGQDLNGKPTAFAGTIFADGSGTLSPGEADFNEAGTIGAALPLSGTFSTSGSFSRGSAGLTYQLPAQAQVTPIYVFYFVSPTDLFFAAVDTTDATHPRLSGEMLAQNANAVFDSTILPASSASVASGSGLDTSASVFAGLLQGDGNGNATLTFDENDGGTITGGATAASAAGTYFVFPNGRATFAGLGSRVSVAYFTDRNQGFLIGTDSAATVGLLEQRIGGPAFSAGSVLDGYTLSAPVALDNQVLNIIGQITADGSTTVNGTLDEAGPNGTSALDQVVAVPYTVAANGRGTITTAGLTGLPSNLVLYVVSPAKFRAVSVTSGDAHPEVVFFDH